MFRLKFTAVALAALLVAAMPFAACVQESGNEEQAQNTDHSTTEENQQTADSGGTAVGMMTDDDYLEVDGEKLKRRHGEGEEVLLRGVNAGGYLLTEQWMTAVGGDSGTGYYDHKTITDAFVSRFGEDGAQDLWAYYREQFWTQADFANVRDMGLNVIRLPFTYMNVDFGGEYDFSRLDTFVEGAAEYGLYTILDLHGAYGSQNGKDHSGEMSDDVDFYENEEKQQKTLALWQAITEHYRDNPAVAAFDLLNEPGEYSGLTSRRHWDFYDRAYDAVRQIDSDRIVIMEACWNPEDIVSPQEYGWENCIYSYHNYAGTDGGTSVGVQAGSYGYKFTRSALADYGVPVYLGEFNCYDDEESWNYVLTQLNDLGWHYTMWTYKINDAAGEYPGWGIYVSSAENVLPAEDEKDAVMRKWDEISTDECVPYTFSSGNTLVSLMRRYAARTPLRTVQPEGQFALSSEEGMAAGFSRERMADGNYLLAAGGEDVTAAQFVFRSNGDGTVSIGSSYGGNLMFLCTVTDTPCEYGQNYLSLRTAENAVSDWEKFWIKPYKGGYIALSYNAGKYLSLNGNGIIAAISAEEQEAFVFSPLTESV